MAAGEPKTYEYHVTKSPVSLRRTAKQKKGSSETEDIPVKYVKTEKHIHIETVLNTKQIVIDLVFATDVVERTARCRVGTKDRPLSRIIRVKNGQIMKFPGQRTLEDGTRLNAWRFTEQELEGSQILRIPFEVPACFATLTVDGQKFEGRSCCKWPDVYSKTEGIKNALKHLFKARAKITKEYPTKENQFLIRLCVVSPDTAIRREKRKELEKTEN